MVELRQDNQLKFSTRVNDLGAFRCEGIMSGEQELRIIPKDQSLLLVSNFQLQSNRIERVHMEVECFLHLSRYSDARELAREIIADYRKLGVTHDAARNLLRLAMAADELNNFDAARTALEEADPLSTTRE